LNHPAFWYDPFKTGAARLPAQPLERRAMPSRRSSKRTAKGFALIVEAACAAGLTPRRSRGKPVASKGQLASAAMNDAAITAAMRSARETLPGFLALAKKPRAAMEGFAVKIAIREGDGTDYLWIHPFAQIDSQFIGQIGSTPRSLRRLKKGDTVTFAENQIIDWMYMDAGTMRGNYSARAMLNLVLPQEREAFKRRYGLDQDF